MKEQCLVTHKVEPQFEPELELIKLKRHKAACKQDCEPLLYLIWHLWSLWHFLLFYQSLNMAVSTSMICQVLTSYFLAVFVFSTPNKPRIRATSLETVGSTRWWWSLCNWEIIMLLCCVCCLANLGCVWKCFFTILHFWRLPLTWDKEEICCRVIVSDGWALNSAFLLFCCWSWTDDPSPSLQTFSVSPALLFLSECHSTFMTGLWCVPKTDGAQQDGRCCPGNRVESRRKREGFFLVGCSGYQGDTEMMRGGQQGRSGRVLECFSLSAAWSSSFLLFISQSW